MKINTLKFTASMRVKSKEIAKTKQAQCTVVHEHCGFWLYDAAIGDADWMVK
jgi:hypothetical protein